MKTRKKMPKLISVVWQVYSVQQSIDEYGNKCYEQEGNWFAFFDDGTSLIWTYDYELKCEKWLPNPRMDRIPVVTHHA